MGTLFDRIYLVHMVGAALAAHNGGFFRDLAGDYHLVFVSAALLGFVAVALSLGMSPPEGVGAPSARTPGAVPAQRGVGLPRPLAPGGR